MVDLDSCVNCNAGLISASEICPQCGWPKDKPIETERAESEDIEIVSDAETPQVKFVNRLHRPAGVRMLGMVFIAFGIIMASASVIFGSFVMLLVVSGAMGGLGGIGDMSMVMPLPINDIDPEMKSSLSVMDQIPGMEILGATILTFANSASAIDFDLMIVIITEVFVVMAVGIIIGLIYFMFGRHLLKGNKWARYLVIAFAVFSIPVIIPLVSEVNLTVIVSALVSGLVLYYLFKPHVRAYFAQPSIKKEKKSKIKKSKK